MLILALFLSFLTLFLMLFFNLFYPIFDPFLNLLLMLLLTVFDTIFETIFDTIFHSQCFHFKHLIIILQTKSYSAILMSMTIKTAVNTNLNASSEMILSHNFHLDLHSTQGFYSI